MSTRNPSIWGLLLVLSLFMGCKEENPVSPNKPPISSSRFQILPLGDSRVEGDEVDFLSYRYELWKKLEAQNFDIDFLGSRTDPRVYPDFQSKSFDADHEGKSGDRTDQVLARVNALIAADQEAIGNIVLLGAGGNDLLIGNSASSAIENIKAIIDALQSANSSITIFLEKIAAGTSEFNNSQAFDINEFQQFNESITDIAKEKSRTQSPVIVVDMTSLLNDGDYADAIHYNQSGARKIAHQYFAAMDSVLF